MAPRFCDIIYNPFGSKPLAFKNVRVSPPSVRRIAPRNELTAIATAEVRQAVGSTFASAESEIVRRRVRWERARVEETREPSLQLDIIAIRPFAAFGLSASWKFVRLDVQ